MRASSALSGMQCSWPAGTSSSGKIATAGHSGSHSVQSMHSSGSMTSMFGPSWKQSTGHTSTQSVYLHLIQASVTTKVMRVLHKVRRLGAVEGAGILLQPEPKAKPKRLAANCSLHSRHFRHPWRSSDLFRRDLDRHPIEPRLQDDLAAQAAGRPAIEY